MIPVIGAIYRIKIPRFNTWNSAEYIKSYYDLNADDIFTIIQSSNVNVEDGFNITILTKNGVRTLFGARFNSRNCEITTGMTPEE